MNNKMKKLLDKLEKLPESDKAEAFLGIQMVNSIIGILESDMEGRDKTQLIGGRFCVKIPQVVEMLNNIKKGAKAHPASPLILEIYEQARKLAGAQYRDEDMSRPY